MPKSRSTKRNKTVNRGALLSVPLVLFLFGFLWIGLRPSNPAREDVPIQTQTSIPALDPAFSLAGIAGIENIYASAEQLSVPEQRTARIQSAILPHHTLLGEELAREWTTIAENADPSVIVVVGPGHEDQGAELVQTTHGTWKTPMGDVQTADVYINSLAQRGVSLEPTSFENEHSIAVHTPFIANLFPGTPIVPLLGKYAAAEGEASRVAEELRRILPADALIIASIDFSHYLPAEMSHARDQETALAIESRDYMRISSMGPDHLDSIFALQTYLFWSDGQGCRQEQVWHAHNSEIRPDVSPAEGTSYFVYHCLGGEEIVITAAGDVMLGRAVATWLAQTTIEEAFSDAQELFKDSDIAFFNLESVLTDVEPSTGKAIHFKGRPDRVDVLQMLGMTHVSVANNHVDDYGVRGWQDSVENVTEAGIVPVGGYRNDGEIVYAQAGKTRVALVAHDDTIFRVDIEALTSEIEEAAANSDVVIVSFHWGAEYQHTPNQRQIDVAHTAVEAGADIVLGHHPHVLQTVEIYEDALIIYSLGNFVFDQFGFDENESAVMRMNWSDGPKSVEITPIRIKGGFPRLASEEEAEFTLERLASWSDESLQGQIESGRIRW